MPKSNNEPKYEHFVMTFNNYQKRPDLVPTKILNSKISYLCFSKEVGEKNGTPHLQMYCQMTHKVRKSLFEKIFPGEYFWSRPANGSDEQASVYCSKNDNPTFVEFGTKRQIASKVDQIKASDYKTLFKHFLFENRLKIVQLLFNPLPLQKWLKYNKSYVDDNDVLHPNTPQHYFDFLEQLVPRINVEYLPQIFNLYYELEEVSLTKSKRDEIEFYFPTISRILKKPNTQTHSLELELLEDF